MLGPAVAVSVLVIGGFIAWALCVGALCWLAAAIGVEHSVFARPVEIFFPIAALLAASSRW